MKYENFKQVKSIVETIEKHESKLEELNRYNVQVQISNNGGRIYTIGCDTNDEHEYTKLAKTIVQAIKEDLQGRIDNLKIQLDSL